jgi:hypothetical protein
MDRSERDSVEQRNGEANTADSVEARIDEAAKTIVYQKIVGKSEYQLQETGLFNGVEIKDKSIKLKVQRRLKKFQHENKISGRPSLDYVQNPDEALKYAKRKLAETPSKARFVEKNYANVLTRRGYLIPESALKKRRIVDQVTSLAMKFTAPLLLSTNFSALVATPPQLPAVLDHFEDIESDQSARDYFGITGGEEMSEDKAMSEDEEGEIPEESNGMSMHPQLEQSLKNCVGDWMKDDMMPLMANDSCMLNNDFEYTNVEGALMNLVAEIHSRKETFLTSIFAGKLAEQAVQTLAMSLDGADLDERDRYPTLSQYGIPYQDERVCGNILRDLLKVQMDRTGSSTMRFFHNNSVPVLLVMIPPSSTAFDHRNKQAHYKYVSEIIKALDGDHQDTQATRAAFLKSLARDKGFRDDFRDVAQSEGLTLTERLDEETSFAVQSECNFTHTQMRLLRRYLTATIGTPLFARESKVKLELGSDLPEMDTGCYTKGRTRIRWHCKKANQVLLLFLGALEKSEIRNFEHVDVSVSIDHGKGFLRSTLVIVVRGKDGVAKIAASLSLGSAKCKGDSYDILKNTFAPTINNSLHLIKDNGYKISVWGRPDKNKELYCKLGTEPDDESHNLIHQVEVDQWIAGDLKFLMMAAGREHADKTWCFYCDLMNREWKCETPQKVGNMWTNQGLEDFIKKISPKWEKLDAYERKGCKKDYTLLFMMLWISTILFFLYFTFYWALRTMWSGVSF